MKTFALVLLAAALASSTSAATPATVFLPSPNSPLVAIRIAFRTGSIDDPSGKEGLAALTASVMAEGATRSRSYPQILEALYPLAADVRVRVDKEMTVFSGTVHRDNLENFAAILEEQILNPKFSDEDFARKRQDAVDEVSKSLRGNDDEWLGKESLNVLLYAGRPYGHPNLGTVQGLKALRREDLVEFARRHYTLDRLIVGLAGGYPEAFARSFAAKFEALPPTGAPAVELPPAPKVEKTSVLLVEKDARANAVSIGAPIGVTRADDDFYALWVANSYLGEHRTFNGVLMNQLRGVRGLNYGDYSYIENFIQDGGSTFPVPNIPRRQQFFSIWIRPVPPENTWFAVRAALHHLRKLEEEGIPASDFEATKEFLKTYSKLWTQNASRRLGYAIDARVYGKDLPAEIQKRLASITKEQVDAAVRKSLPRDAFDIAVVTANAAKFRDELLSGKPTPMHYDTAGTPPRVLEEDKLIEKLPIPVRPEDVRIVPASEMFEK